MDGSRSASRKGCRPTDDMTDLSGFSSLQMTVGRKIWISASILELLQSQLRHY